MRRFPAPVLATPLALLAAPALGAGGITPVGPKRGDTIPAGKRPTFKLNVRGRGQVWVHVCRSQKKDSRGLICPGESVGRAHRKSGTRFTSRPKYFDYRQFRLNSAGTYYGQAHRIHCDDGLRDCRIEGRS